MRPDIAIGIATVIIYGATIVAIVAAPIVALRVQRKGDEEREKRGRKLWIFKTLMSNRATRLNASYVQALNMIDIEFTEKSERAVRVVWKELLDHYKEWGDKPPQRRKVEDEADLERSNDLLAEMLVKMGDVLGYEFDKVYIKKGFYYPEGLGNIEKEQHALRGALLNLLSGKGAKLPVAVFSQDFEPLTVDPLRPALPIGEPEEGPPITQRLDLPPPGASQGDRS